jgi:hypothetical protein
MYMMPISEALKANFNEPIDDSDICADDHGFDKSFGDYDMWAAFAHFFTSMQQGQKLAKNSDEKLAYKNFFERTKDVFIAVYRILNDPWEPLHTQPQQV